MHAEHQQLPKVGTTIGGKYIVLRLLGEGGMGAVYEVEHVVTKKRFAVKWLAPSLAHSQEAIERFTLEAQTSCAIDHPNIVEVFDVSSEDGAMFLVMELLRGESLAERMAAVGAMDPVKCASLLLPVLHGLQEAHERGIVHRDLKPDNVFLSQPRPGLPVVAKLLDFGISKMQQAGDGSAMRLTAAGMMMGTTHYMAPEQTQDAANVNAQADVYSFGVMLYEGLSGRLPFLANNFGKLVFQIMTEEAPEIRSYVPDLPPALAQVVMQTLCKQPGDRPPGARTLGLQICDALGLPHTLFAPSGASWGSHSAPPPNLARAPSGIPPARLGKGAGTASWAGTDVLMGARPMSAEPMTAPSGIAPAATHQMPRPQRQPSELPGPPPARSKVPLLASFIILLATLAAAGAVVLSSQAEQPLWTSPPQPAALPADGLDPMPDENEDRMPTVEQLVDESVPPIEVPEVEEEVEEEVETPTRRRRGRRRARMTPQPAVGAMNAGMSAAAVAASNTEAATSSGMSAPSMSAVMTRLQQGSSELGAF